MRASCSERVRGFTIAELVIVIVIAATLAAVALPRMNGAVGLRDDTWRDQVVSALRQARKTAVASRRLVCATVTTGSVALSIAAANPASACSAAIVGVDGAAVVSAANAPVTTASPGATLYFQPAGRISSDGTGNTISDFRIAVGTLVAVSIVGETGHVE